MQGRRRPPRTRRRRLRQCWQRAGAAAVRGGGAPAAARRSARRGGSTGRSHSSATWALVRSLNVPLTTRPTTRSRLRRAPAPTHPHAGLHHTTTCVAHCSRANKRACGRQVAVRGQRAGGPLAKRGEQLRVWRAGHSAGVQRGTAVFSALGPTYAPHPPRTTRPQSAGTACAAHGERCRAAGARGARGACGRSPPHLGAPAGPPTPPTHPRTAVCGPSWAPRCRAKHRQPLAQGGGAHTPPRHSTLARPQARATFTVRAGEGAWGAGRV